MNTPSASLSICVTAQAVILRVAGRASFNCSADFKRVILELWQKGRPRFVLDLTECLMMDSTFLGVLIGFVAKVPAGREKAARPVIALYKPNQRVLDLLDNLGVADYFQMVDKLDLPAAAFAQVPQDTKASKVEITKTSLEAHQALMSANPENVPRFKDVVQFLAEDIKTMAGK